MACYYNGNQINRIESKLDKVLKQFAILDSADAKLQDFIGMNTKELLQGLMDGTVKVIVEENRYNG